MNKIIILTKIDNVQFNNKVWTQLYLMWLTNYHLVVWGGIQEDVNMISAIAVFLNHSSSNVQVAEDTSLHALE